MTAQPLVSADDLAILGDMSPTELRAELALHDAIIRRNASDAAYRAAIVNLLPVQVDLDIEACGSVAHFPTILAETRPSRFFAALAALNAPPAA